MVQDYDNPALAVTPGQGLPPDYPSQGTPMDVDNHPENSHKYKMAGDVVPIRPMDGHDFYSTPNVKAAAGDTVNRLIARGGLGGYSNNDMSNIKVLRPSK